MNTFMRAAAASAGALFGIVAALAAAQAIDWILGIGEE